MGLNDHRRQWEFVLKATPEACEEAFMATFDGGRLGKNANFEFKRADDPLNGPHIEAIYVGRKGLGAVSSAMFRTHRKLEARAMGSTIAFAADASDQPGRVTCTMWLKRSGPVGGVFTADVGTFRAYMQDVAKSLARLDPSVRVSKG